MDGFEVGVITFFVAFITGLIFLMVLASQADHRNFVNSCHRTGGYVVPHTTSEGDGICVQNKLPGQWG